MARYDVMAFGRSGDEREGGAVSDEVALARAVAAVDRADAVLRFAGDADPRLVAELEALSSGVRELIRSSTSG